MRPALLPLLLAAPVALASCSYSDIIYAIATQGTVAFAIEPDVTCPERIDVVDSSGNSIWRIAWAPESVGLPDDTDVDCADAYPMVFGQAPVGFEESVIASPLAHGQRYSVRGRAPGIRYGGDFSLLRDGSVVNFGSDGEIAVPDTVDQ